MAKPVTPARIICTLILFLGVWNADACSMYKVTVGDKTMVGNNEDSWRQTAMIRFVPAFAGRFGVAYVGYADKAFPDGAVNEYGLAFDAFTMPGKANLPPKDSRKADFSYGLFPQIMEQCKTVDEVRSFLQAYNLHTLNGSVLFNGAMLLFVDRAGHYLVVEPDAMTQGTEDRFVLSNFSYADTPDKTTVKQQRYRNGVAFLQNKIDTGMAFCTALSDTMSVHRPKAGDGTLYTTIYDLRDGIIHTYFFHDYGKRISFNLKNELAKGEHHYLFADLFPKNEGYRKFLRYKTPQNSPFLYALLSGCVLLFLFSFVYFGIRTFKRHGTPEPVSRDLGIGVAVLCLAMAYYCVVLLKNRAIFYFPAPYADGSVSDFTSYLPFTLLALMVPLLWLNIRLFRKKTGNRFPVWLLGGNNLAFLVLLGWFWYWGLFG